MSLSWLSIYLIYIPAKISIDSRTIIAQLLLEISAKLCVTTLSCSGGGGHDTDLCGI